MGMAASQARLLSITTRLSDNELRSQLINNQKIRLATESAKASERYVAALNNTKMMYSAYDVKGNPLNKELTFANLTAYSSYNNQYGLKNLAGQILVSEETAHNYEEAWKIAGKGDTNTTALEEFLKMYNLEKSTTFFDGITTDIIDACLGMDTENGKSSGLTGADLKAMYLGGEDTKNPPDVHEGYDAIMSGTEYNTKFEPLFTNYINTYETYEKEMHKYIDTYNKESTANGGELYLTDLSSKINSAGSDLGLLQGYCEEFAKKLEQANGMAVQGSTYFTDMAAYVRDLANGIARQETDRTGGTITVNGEKDENGNWVDFDFQFTPPATVIPGPTEDGESNGTFAVGISTDPDYYIVTQTGTDPDSNESATITYYIPKTTGDVYIQEEPDPEALKGQLLGVLNTYLGDCYPQFDYSKFNLPIDSAAYNARVAFEEAAKALAEYMFGPGNPNVSKDDYQKLNDLAFIFEVGSKQPGLTAGEGGADNFYSVLDVLILDAVMNELGEPVVTWIDTTNPNEDATAKAQWYTNLFNRMQTVETTENEDGEITEERKTNYQVIENGLATSAEWLQFALETGLVSMEQVDANNKWCSTLYSNCSDITETTDSTEATIAEAEYNSTMAKIEAKDKQFDMQLKNIDTEHESLQTEYDSIKSVLDKHIERNFKMYSA